MRASAALAGTSGEQSTSGSGHPVGARGLVLAALGVVFGDIGTSPLYALQTVFTIDGGAVGPTPGDVYGVISLMFWSITLIVSIKYVSVVMRADNQGEGGVKALVALIQGGMRGRPDGQGTPRDGPPGMRASAASVGVALGVLGAALFYGDSLISPAISVLSAVEGVRVAAPGLSRLVLPIAVTIL